MTTVNDLIQNALNLLTGDHIQNNKHRMGLIGSTDIDGAIASLELAAGEAAKNEGEELKAATSVK